MSTSRLNVVMDCIIFDLQPYGGISRFWCNLISGLLALESDLVLHLLMPVRATTGFGGRVRALAAQSKNAVVHEVSGWRPLRVERGLQPRLPAGLGSKTVFHSSYYRVVSSAPNVVTVHDFQYELNGSPIRALIYRTEKMRALRRSSFTVCVSKNTLRDLQRVFPQFTNAPAEVVAHGIEPIFNALPPGHHASSESDYVLFVGKRERYKNFWSLVTALREIAELKLVLLGPPLARHEIARLQSALSNRFTCLTAVDDLELVDLYQHAFALVYPSSYEGFGLPIVEAMACGCPFVACANSSIPEVAGSAGILVNNPAPVEIRDALRSLKDPIIRRATIERGFVRAKEFSWRVAAENYYRVYRKVAQS
jgi:mannosyltransferase